MHRVTGTDTVASYHQWGFSLVEVLIALVVLSVGLLGLAALQTGGLQYNHDAYLRSKATLLAQDMADRMRANRKGAVAGDYAITSAPANPGYDCSSTFPSGSTGCTAAQLAKADRYQWYQEASSDLPDGCAGATSCRVCLDSNPGAGSLCDGNGSVYSIIVSWQGKDPKASSGFSTQKFITRFRP